MDAQTTAPPESGAQKFLNGFNRASGFVMLIWTIALSVGVGWLSFRDTQTVQSQTIRAVEKEQKDLREYINLRRAERDKQFDEIKQQNKELVDKIDDIKNRMTDKEDFKELRQDFKQFASRR